MMVSKIQALRFNFASHKLFLISVKKFMRDDCFTLSLSVSFVFLLSIIPFATLSILIVDFVQDLFFAQANWTGRVADMLTDEMNQVIPFVSREWMKSHVINSDAHGSFRAINFLMLPIISGLIFKTLESSYRKIFQLPARHFFGFCVHNITEVNLLYGSLSSVILILMWIFYSAMALLYSIEIMHVLHRGNWLYRWW